MKKIIFLGIIFFILFFLKASFSADNIYGDYLLSQLSKTISLDLEGAELVDVLKMFSQQTGLNFVSSETVRPRNITLYMDKVPTKEALDTIFKANNLVYDYYPQANIFIVKETGKPALELKTKVYSLKYIRVDSSRLQKEINATIGAGGGGQEDGEDGEGGEGGEGGGGGGGAGTGIQGAVEKALTEFGKVSVDPITNSLIVIDVPSQIAVIDEIIEKLDIPLQKVMIEVEMLDVSKRLIDKIGIKYGEGYGLYVKYLLPNRTSSFPFTGLLRSATKPSTTIGTLDMNDYSQILQMLSSDTTTKFLARPKILTLSNETAEVKITKDEVIGITTTTSGETATTSQTAERAETGTKLRVTPQVNFSTGEITLFVEVSNRVSQDSGLAMSGLTGGNVKNIEERGTKSVIRLKDGELLLISGLIKNDDAVTVYKLPFLGDIPILGKIFSYTDSDKQERELLVFITPYIITDQLQDTKDKAFLNREQSEESLKRKAMKIALDRISK